MLYDPNITFQSKKKKILPILSPERSEYGLCIKTLQVTIIQSINDVAVCENE